MSSVLDIRVGVVENAEHESIIGLVVDAGVVLVAEFDSVEIEVAASLTLLYTINIGDMHVAHLEKLEITCRVQSTDPSFAILNSEQ